MPNFTNSQWETARGTSADPAIGFTQNPGGDCAIYTASGTLSIGDAVYFSADNTVAKAAVTANYAKFAGIVVGGDSLQGYVAQDVDLRSATQLVAALNGKNVIVQISGDARVIGGAANAAGLAVTGDAVTAGRVTVTGAVAGVIIGTMVVGNALATNGVMRIAPR